jgi:hypothetical protein
LEELLHFQISNLSVQSAEFFQRSGALALAHFSLHMELFKTTQQREGRLDDLVVDRVELISIFGNTDFFWVVTYGN